MQFKKRIQIYLYLSVYIIYFILFILIQLFIQIVDKIHYQYQQTNQTTMIAKIIETLKDNKNSVLYSLLGTLLLGGYYFVGRHALAKQYGIQINKKQNLLDTSFEELLKENNQPNVMKIVFTQTDKSSGNYRKMVIDQIKASFPKKDLGVLINCSPKKLYDAGCEAFVATFQHDDQQYADYIINFLKSELLIEDTIQKIERVSQMQQPNGGRFAIMLCDNNALDMKRITTPKGILLHQRVQQQALERLNIKQVDLYDLYKCVIHFEEDPSTQTREQIAQNQFIEQLWGNKDFRGFYQKFTYDNKKSKSQNVNVVIKFLHQKIREYQKHQQEQRRMIQKK